MTECIFPGTFDPISVGHEDVIRTAAGLFERVVVAVSQSDGKRPLFAPAQRLALAEAVAKGYKNVAVVPFSGLLTDLCKARGATVIVRGLRNIMDYTYESELYAVYHDQLPALKCVYLPAERTVSGTVIRELMSLKADYSAYVPPVTLPLLKAYLAQK
ncbi:MAG: pantetheine-phosphate adenylyltransferase [Clostridiales bacterium]|jgi:pantetheine-phosphate adenylyltransferase|nr:pantetheine-phosphate adenylyltransferase [Clostridiales bacterium]